MLRNKKTGRELNLFMSLPRNANAIPTSSHILYGWLISLVVAIAIHVTLLWQHGMIRTEEQSIKNELATIFKQINSVAGYDDKSNTDNKLVGVVKAGGFIRHVDAYEYFYSLALIKNDRVWLNSVNLDFENSIIKLDGNASDSSSMYRMASAIKNANAYKSDNLGLQNVKKNISDKNTSVYDFSLTNMKATNARRKSN
jgi:hypothetical protein